jgi:Fe-S-cluster-containing dehydrogenase component/formate-dependent nitrite reductase membrane component NrfD
MPRYGFAIDNRVCIGCHACTVACKSEHGVALGVNRTWVKYIEKGQYPNTRRSFSVQRCNHCDDAPCVEICPVTSLYRRPDGIVDFDNQRCIGCTACMQACPYDALYLDPDTLTAAKCNYCTHRVDNGYEPACVVVCPVEAIVSGDLDDPASRISKLDREQRVQYPKPEKDTNPKLFYVGGETAALNPTLAGPSESYLWSGAKTPYSLPQLESARDESESTARARRVYDTRSKPGTWGWMVSAYVTTKAIATGMVMVPVALHALGLSPQALPTTAALVALLFLGVTGALLVGDLKQPQRFLYILLRPQWKSWLVRGAYLITAFSLMTVVCWLVSISGPTWETQAAVGAMTALLAAAVATYTAFLFAQAKGRDYWQNPLLVVSMLADAIVAGLAGCKLAGLMKWSGGMLAVAPEGGGLVGTMLLGTLSSTGDPSRACLAVAVVVLAIITLAEFLPKHQTANAALTAKLILRGQFSRWFWGGVVFAGLVTPAVLLVANAGSPPAAMLLVVGIACKNHILVQAPQQVPLS